MRPRPGMSWMSSSQGRGPRQAACTTAGPRWATSSSAARATPTATPCSRTSATSAPASSSRSSRRLPPTWALPCMRTTRASSATRRLKGEEVGTRCCRSTPESRASHQHCRALQPARRPGVNLKCEGGLVSAHFMRALQLVQSLRAEFPRRSHPEHPFLLLLSVRLWTFALCSFSFCIYSGGAILAVVCPSNGRLSCRDHHGTFQKLLRHVSAARCPGLSCGHVL
mmetsp:Transcript_38908/g.100754  ORF Transcript_38908/g.100754 Transcript_38908/m.100754 type:complete len:225 (+) Transcript_38908:373-1047(+)